MSLTLHGTTGVIGPVNKGFAKATGSTTNRNLEDRFADVVNVKDFGAIGNGIVDDTAAIQAAINTVTPWGTLFFPEGIYKISSTITFPQSSGLNGIKVLGIGNGTVIKPEASVSTVFNCLGDFVTFDSIQIDGALTISATAIVFNGDNNNNNVTVRNCFFGSLNKGIEIRTDSWSVYSCRFTNVNVSIDCANWAMNGSCYDNYTLGGITSVLLRTDTTALSPQQPEGVRIFSNTFLNTAAGAKAIDIRSGLELQIFNNIIDQTGTGGFAVYAQPDAGQVVSGLKVTNNWLAAGATISGYSVWVAQGSGNNANNILIQGNTLTSTTIASVGVAITDVSGYWILNNEFYGTGLALFTNPLVIVTSNSGTILGNKGLNIESANVDDNTIRGQLSVSNSTTGATNINAVLGSVTTKISSSASAGVVGTNTNHDLFFQTNNANRFFLPAGSDEVLPSTDNVTSLGSSSFRWSDLVSANINLKPDASVTPANNGEMIIEATNNTTITFKYKGSDGTVRSGTISLT